MRSGSHPVPVAPTVVVGAGRDGEGDAPERPQPAWGPGRPSGEGRWLGRLGRQPQAAMIASRTKASPPTVIARAATPPRMVGPATGTRRLARQGIQRGQRSPQGRLRPRVTV